MNHPYLTRSAAAAAFVGMLAVAAPALAQTTTTQPTTTQQTQSQTPQATSTQGQTQIQCMQGTTQNQQQNQDLSSKGNKPIEGVGSATTTPSGPTTSGADASTSNNGDCPATGNTTPGSVTRGRYTPTNTNTNTNTNMNATPSSGTMQPTAGSTMQNTLRDNPNGSNWLQKFNRPNVAATNKKHHYHTNSLGTNPSQPPK